MGPSTTFYVLTDDTGEEVTQKSVITRCNEFVANKNGVLWDSNSEQEDSPSCGKVKIPTGTSFDFDALQLSNGVCFWIQEGCIKLILFHPTDVSQTQISILGEGDHFYIPASNSFKIENSAQMTAEIFFTVDTTVE